MVHSLTPPSCTVREAFESTLKSVDDDGLRMRLEAITGAIARNGQLYTQLATGTELHKYPSVDHVGSVSKDELQTNYRSRFVPFSTRRRHIYDEIKRGGICPLCGCYPIHSLDHYLPQSKFPDLAVAPPNLVPSCSRCNESKRDSVPRDKQSQTLHPYFDRLDAGRWLFAFVEEKQPAAVGFYVNPPSSWSRLQQQRLATHFKVHWLARTYAESAGAVLDDLQSEWRAWLPEDAPVELERRIRLSVDANPDPSKNRWRDVMYEVLYSSRWFLSGRGFIGAVE